ncbi:CDP-glycerol glycerophosphotransferase family protein [Mesobacillus campisalis]|uniref:CDP-glycerol glycerophosphotransferase family protein n=1 Tax=Mesobacillus campisalis TaxID=1408103 RepID=UPI00069B32E9|nr:CDP-glycerol glycerophosphotransferase family protein [Mesobacillus campisalis]
MIRKKLTGKNCLIQSIYMEGNCFYIELGVPRWALADPKLTLLLVERYTAKKKEYPLTVVRQNASTLQACLMETDLQQLLDDGKDWDVYLTFSQNDSVNRIRLSSNLFEVELLFYHNDDKMLAPFTTNKGNISFKSQSPCFVTKVEQIDIIDKDHIRIKGYVIHPIWFKHSQPSDIQKSLVFSTKDEEYVFKVPLKVVDRTDLSKEYRRGDSNFIPIGYEAVVPAKALLSNQSEPCAFKAHIEISYFENNRKVTTKTSAITMKVPNFSKKSLIKKVNGNKKIISIGRTQKAREIHIKIENYDFKNHIKTKVKEKLVFVKRHSTVKDLYKMAFYLIGLLPGSRKIVVFESFLGKQFSDNPRAICEYLKENNYDYKMYWSVDKKYLHHFKDKNVNCIPRFSIKWLFVMPRARYWVTNSRMPAWLPKPKNTIYLQTWHGTPLKRLAADMEEVYMPGTTAENYKNNFIKEAKKWDYLISPNAYSTEIFRRAFQFENEVLETGYPRNDFIFRHNNEETRGDFISKYGLPVGKKIILYAPTWRDNQFYGKGKYRFDLNMDLDSMKEQLGEEYIILFRLHYLVSENLDLTPYEGFAYDFSNHEDIRELYLMADILVTDYSSVFFDYGNLKRPMIFYVYDIEQYRDHLRGFYFNFEQEAPGPLVRTTGELIHTIKSVKEEALPSSSYFDSFHEKFCYLECGDSTRKVVEKIFTNAKKAN